jgi:hypothetical protein
MNLDRPFGVESLPLLLLCLFLFFLLFIFHLYIFLLMLLLLLRDWWLILLLSFSSFKLLLVGLVPIVGKGDILHDCVSSHPAEHHAHLGASARLNHHLEVLSEEDHDIRHTVGEAILELVDPFPDEGCEGVFHFFNELGIITR